MTNMSDLSYTERLEVERIAQEIRTNGVGTVDLNRYQGGTGKRHRFREPLARLLGCPIDYGIDRDWDTGERFGWFERREEQISDEQRTARKRLGFA